MRLPVVIFLLLAGDIMNELEHDWLQPEIVYWDYGRGIAVGFMVGDAWTERRLALGR